jgi:hypothetical protein
VVLDFYKEPPVLVLYKKIGMVPVSVSQEKKREAQI